MQDYFSDYYLEVVKDGEVPKWPRPEEELDIHSQPLGSGFTQFWAYPKDEEGNHEDLPHAEVIASQNSAHASVVLIDQLPQKAGDKKEILELIVAKDGHAWGKTESSIANLEDNLTTILEYAKNSVGITVEHFMTTDKVLPEVEKKLDDLESAGGAGMEEADQPETAVMDDSPVAPTPVVPVPQASSVFNHNEDPIPPKNKSFPKLGVIIPVIVIVALFVGVVMFRDKIMGEISSLQNGATPSVTPAPTVEPTPSPTPTPSIDRSKYKVRVLNGTTTSGAASALADKLKALGWQILSTGNATNSAVAQTYVRTKANQDVVGSTLISDLVSDYKAASSSALKDADKADAEVVIGKE